MDAISIRIRVANHVFSPEAALASGMLPITPPRRRPDAAFGRNVGGLKLRSEPDDLLLSSYSDTCAVRCTKMQSEWQVNNKSSYPSSYCPTDEHKLYLEAAFLASLSL